MKYVHKVTGTILVTDVKITGNAWEEVKPKKEPKKEVKKKG